MEKTARSRLGKRPKAFATFSTAPDDGEFKEVRYLRSECSSTRMTCMQKQAGLSLGTEKSSTSRMETIGLILMAGSAALDLRLFWEATVLTWREGPQMVGFSLAHGPFALLVVAPFGLAVWVCMSLGIIIWRKIKKRRITKQSWVALTGAVLILGASAIPQSFWDALFVGKLASSPQAAKLFVYAAASGEKRTIRGMLEKGVPISSIDREGNTGLHLAAATGSLDTVAYLIDKGAAVNAVNFYGDSPLERALANHRAAVETLLTAHGAQVLKGSPEQRDQVTKEIVRRDIDEMNSSDH